MNNKSKTNKIIIALVNNSDYDRCDVVYIGDDENTAAAKLYASYNELLTEFEQEIDADNSVYESIDDFKTAALGEDDIPTSAYIQCNDFHINFELHICNPEEMQ